MLTLQELFQGTLRDIYYAETTIIKGLTKMTRKAASEQLAAALQARLDISESHVERLEKIFEVIGAPTKSKKCEAIHGIVDESEKIMKKAKDRMVRDAAMLASAQGIAHYEISRYGTLRAWAEQLHLPVAAQLLDEAVHEAKEFDSKLSALALAEINVNAEKSESEDENVDTESRSGSAPRVKKTKPAPNEGLANE
ncbi:MAG: DUF892 family protein [Proteobacteria bacterium]|nr:DUF892 family protein [Pseudomonadota bacterium]